MPDLKKLSTGENQCLTCEEMSCQAQSCTWNSGNSVDVSHPQWLVQFQNTRKLDQCVPSVQTVPYPSSLYWGEAYNRQAWENKRQQIQAQNRQFASQQRRIQIQSKQQSVSNNFVQNFKSYVPTSQRTSTGYDRMQPREPLGIGWQNGQNTINLRRESTRFIPNYQSCFECCPQHSCWNSNSNAMSQMGDSDISVFPPVYQRMSNPPPVVRSTAAQSLSELTTPLTIDTSLEYEVSHRLNISTVSGEPLLAIAQPNQPWTELQRRKSGSQESIRPTVSQYNSLQNHQDERTLKLTQNLLLQNSFLNPELSETKQPSAREVMNNNNILAINHHTQNSNKTLQTIQEQHQHLFKVQPKTVQVNRKRKIKVEETEVSAKKESAFGLNHLPTSFTPPDLLSSSYKFFEAGSQDWIKSGEAAHAHVWNWPNTTSRPHNLFAY